MVADIMMQGPAQGAGAGLQVEDAFEQPVQRLFHEHIHMVMVVADGTTGDLHRQQGQHGQPGCQAVAEEKQAQLNGKHR